MPGGMTRWVWPLLDELNDEDGRDEQCHRNRRLLPKGMNDPDDPYGGHLGGPS